MNTGHRSSGVIRLVLAALLLTGIAVGGCAVWQASQPSPAPPPSQASQPASAPATHAGDAYRPYIYGGLPKTSQHLTLLKNKGYMAGYSEEHKDPAWVAYRQVILDELSQGLSAQRIYQDLVTEHHFVGSYYSVRRFVGKQVACTDLPFRRLECLPGQEAQVDFGTGAPVVGGDGGRR
jgi:hypothetical protein